VGCRSIATRLAEHPPALGSVSSRRGLAAYCGAGLVDLVRSAGSVGASPRERGHCAAEQPVVPKVLFLFSMSKSSIYARHPYRSGLAVRVAIQEVNDVSILFCNHGANRCRCSFYRRTGSVGRESVSEEPSRRSPAEPRGKEESKCRPTRLTTRK